MNKKDLMLNMVKRNTPAILSNQFVTNDDEKVKSLCADLVAYKVLKALYSICRESVDDVTWDECVGIVKTNPNIFEATVPVILYTMDYFVTNIGFNFDGGHTELADLIEEDEPGETNGVLQGVKLFSEDYGEFLIDIFFLNAEVELYKFQRDTGRTSSWTDYLSEIQKNRSVWDILLNAFYDALKQLDFKVGWLSDELEEVKFMHGAQPEET